VIGRIKQWAHCWWDEWSGGPKQILPYMWLSWGCGNKALEGAHIMSPELNRPGPRMCGGRVGLEHHIHEHCWAQISISELMGWPHNHNETPRDVRETHGPRGVSIVYSRAYPLCSGGRVGPIAPDRCNGPIPGKPNWHAGHVTPLKSGVGPHHIKQAERAQSWLTGLTGRPSGLHNIH
jgi:hypothetical protein